MGERWRLEIIRYRFEENMEPDPDLSQLMHGMVENGK